MRLLTPVSSPPTRPAPFVRCRGTTYPFAPPPTVGVDDRTPVGSGDPLVDGLVASLGSQLQTPFASDRSVAGTVERYARDHAVLTRAAEEVRQFLDRVLDQYLTPTTDPRTRADRRAELLAGLPLPQRPRHRLSAEFLANPPSEVVSELRTAVELAVRELVAGFVVCLQRLVQQCVCGLIDRPRPDLGRFTFFTEERTSRVVPSETRRRRRGNRQATSRVVGVDHVTTSETTTTHRRFTRHEHHVMDATELAPPFTRWPLPRRVGDLVTATPPWLRSHLRVVEGTVVLERTVAWDTTRTTTRVLAERDEPVYAPDPALVLGDFVLAGWGDREIPPARPARPARLPAREMIESAAGVLLGLVFWGLSAGVVRDPAWRAALVVTLVILIHRSYRRLSSTPSQPAPGAAS